MHMRKQYNIIVIFLLLKHFGVNVTEEGVCAETFQ